MVAENKAVFQQNGDPCVIDFTFKGNAVVVKERGKCGNHRGMTCLFDDSYKKKAIPAPKREKEEITRLHFYNINHTFFYICTRYHASKSALCRNRPDGHCVLWQLCAVF